jgi:hypothetical protein
MFENFSKAFESGFRVMAIIWITVWSVVNLLTYGINFATYPTLNNNQKAEWVINSLGSFIGLILGIFLIFLLVNVASTINKSKKVTTLSLITICACTYFILPTFIDIFSKALFNSSQLIDELPKIIMWILPSVTFLVLSVMYTINLSKYNQELSLNKEVK